MLIAAGHVIQEKFEILSQIGEGGFGTVYKARQIDLDRLVAIKILHASVEEDARRRFEREATALSRLQHKNIPGIYSFGFFDYHPYMATEYVRGSSLEELLAQGRLTPQRAVKIAIQICNALSCAHANGIIHRDLKPSNVLICQESDSEGEQVKVIDFGLAKFDAASQDLQRLTEAGTAVGSVHYMSPEQCAGKPVDQRSDVYSVGCILHECLTGKPPYGGQHSAMIMMQHVQGDFRSVAEVLQQHVISLKLQETIDHAVSKSPDERFQTAQQLAEQLSELLDAGCLDGQEGDGKLHSQLKPRKKQPPLFPGKSINKRTLSTATALTLLPIAICLMLILFFIEHRGTPMPNAHISSLDALRQANLRWIDDKRSYSPTHISDFEKVISADNIDHLLTSQQKQEALTCLALSYAEANRFAPYHRTLQQLILLMRREHMNAAMTNYFAFGKIATFGADQQNVSLEEAIRVLADTCTFQIDAATDRPFKNERLFQLTKLECSSGDAARAYKMASGEFPLAQKKDLPSLYMTCAIAKLQLGQPEEAESFLHKVDSSVSVCDFCSHQDYWNFHALCSLLNGNLEKAEWYLSLPSHDPFTEAIRALIAAKKGHFSDANAHYEFVKSYLKLRPEAFLKNDLGYTIELYTNIVKAHEPSHAAQIESELRSMDAAARAYAKTLNPHIDGVLPSPQLGRIKDRVSRMMSEFRSSENYEKYSNLAVERACRWGSSNEAAAIDSARVELVLGETSAPQQIQAILKDMNSTGWLQSKTGEIWADTICEEQLALHLTHPKAPKIIDRELAMAEAVLSLPQISSRLRKLMWFRYAESLEEQKRFAESVNAIAQALAADKEPDQITYVLLHRSADQYTALGNHKEGKRLLTEIVSMTQGARPPMGMADIYLRIADESQRDPKPQAEIREQVEKMLATDPYEKLHCVHYWQAAGYLNFDREKSESLLQKAEALRTPEDLEDLANITIQRWHLCTRDKDFAAAEEQLHLGLNINGFAREFSELAGQQAIEMSTFLGLTKAKAFSQRLLDYGKARKLNILQAWMMLRLADFAAQEGDWSRAASIYAQAGEKFERDVDKVWAYSGCALSEGCLNNSAAADANMAKLFSASKNTSECCSFNQSICKALSVRFGGHNNFERARYWQAKAEELEKQATLLKKQ